jgi:hypothetical protein
VRGSYDLERAINIAICIGRLTAIDEDRDEAMDDISKTLFEMSAVERSRIIATVVDALEAASENAEEDGDSQLKANANSIACTLRGCRVFMSDLDFVAAEKLLEQAIMLMQLLSTRRVPTETMH